jgi:hypothetical protein
MWETQPTPFPLDPTWMKKFDAATGDWDKKFQAKLAKEIKLSYRSGVGELIWAMTTCHPDLAYVAVKLSQSNHCSHEHHYHGLRHALKYLYVTKVRHQDRNSKRALSHLSTAINKTCSLQMITQNMMPTYCTCMQIRTGLHVPKLYAHLEVLARAWPGERLRISVNSNLHLRDLPPKRNSWRHTTQRK